MSTGTYWDTLIKLDNDAISSAAGYNDLSGFFQSADRCYNTSLSFFHITKPYRPHIFHFFFESIRHAFGHIAEYRFTHFLTGHFKRKLQIGILDVANNPLNRTVIDIDDIFKYEHPLFDLFCKLRILNFKGIQNRSLSTAVDPIQNLNDRFDTASTCIVLRYGRR